MKKARRMQLKLILIVIGIAVLLVIGISKMVQLRITQPGGECITIEDALILAKAAEADFVYAQLYEKIAESGGEYLTYADFRDIMTFLGVTLEENPSYKDNFYVLKVDWYSSYDIVLQQKNLMEVIQESNFMLLGNEETVTDIRGEEKLEHTMYSSEGIYSVENSSISDYLYEPVVAMVKDREILAVKSKESEYTLKNVWVMEQSEETLDIFLDHYKIAIPYSGDHIQEKGISPREEIVDLAFADGKIADIKIKGEKENARLMSVSKDSIELENKGIYPIEEDMRIYRLYGKQEEVAQSDLIIGYNFTDYVFEDGKIVACLITRDEAMENIRVLIQTSDYTSKQHESVKFSVDTAFEVISQDKSNTHEAGEIIEITKDSELWTGNRIYIKPKALTSRISMLSIKRAQGTPTYRGILEIAKNEEGLLLVNEVLLEEYLYAVVPSEMPAGYPIEALKAQAICARTYAYKAMRNSSLKSFGAHVDDSTSFQVYNNVKEHTNTTTAVNETKGQLIYYNEDLAGAYYYSTSCGYGTNASIWGADNTDSYPYLVSKKIGVKEMEVKDDVQAVSEMNTIDMSIEENFKAYITQTNTDDFEKEESWYRWNFTFGLDTGVMEERMKKRFASNEKQVLTLNKDGEYVSQSIGNIGKVKNITIVKRNQGGVIEELLIECSKDTYKILTEYNVRYVLADGVTSGTRQDGSIIQPSNLLPSAFLIIEPTKEEEVVTGYSILGGGFGHGVGMSQNGAKNMANAGKNSQDIITFFYEGSDLKEIY